MEYEWFSMLSNGFPGDETSNPIHISDTLKKCMGYYPDRCMEYERLSNRYLGDEHLYSIQISDTQKSAWDIIRIFKWNMNGYPMVIRLIKNQIPCISLIPQTK